MIQQVIAPRIETGAPTWRIVAAESILIETRIFFSHNLQSEPRARMDKLLCGNYRKHFTKNGMVYWKVPQKNIQKESKIKICFLDSQTASVSMRQNSSWHLEPLIFGDLKEPK